MGLGGSVSVVVAAFNVERYIEQCLDSLAAQTHPELEVIVVLDAPTDGTAEIAHRYSDRFRIVEMPQNVGLAGARAQGMTLAQGDYLAFVDGDDWVAPTIYADMVKTAAREDAEIVSCAYQRVSNDGQIVIETVPFPDESAKNPLRGHSSRLLWFAWRNLYSRALLDRAGLTFDPALRTGEDGPFNLAAFVAAKRTATVDTVGYFYRENPEGLTMQKYLPYLSDCLQRSHTAKADFARANRLANEFWYDLRLYEAENLLPRLLANALRAPGVAPARAVREVLRLPMVREISEYVPLTAPRQRGQQVILGLTKARQARILARYLTR